jgi:hypothetical protein
MTIFFESKILYAERHLPNNTSVLSQCLSYEFPQRHIRDFLISSEILFRDEAEDPLDFRPYRLVPWTLIFNFDARKINSRMTWIAMVRAVVMRFEDQFDIQESDGLGDNGREQIVMRLMSKVGESLLRFNRSKNSGDMFKFMSQV